MEKINLFARRSPNPNLPGMSPNRQAWAYREREGFHRVSTISPCTTNANLRGQESPMFDNSNHIFPDTFDNQNESPSIPHFVTRPSTAPFSSIPTHDDVPPSAGLGAFHLGGRTLENTNHSSPTFRPMTATIPRFVSTDKVVCRFHALMETKRPWEDNGPLGISRIESHLLRYMTILYYVYDDTVEINEVKEMNSGLIQGVFLKRIKAKSENNKPLVLTDFLPGNNIKIFGHEFHITDADSFTRNYFKNELGIELSLPERPMTASNRCVSRSFSPGLDFKEKSHTLGSQFATGLGPVESTIYDKDRNFRSRSSLYQHVKAELDKSHRFHKYDGQHLRFICIEVNQQQPPYFPRLEDSFASLRANNMIPISDLNRQQYHGFLVSDSAKKYVFSFYLDNNHADLGVLEKQVNAQGEPSLLVKKGLIPRDWRHPDRGHFEANDFHVGGVLDIFGRYFLLIDCDEHTRHYCEQELLINQVPVLLMKEEMATIIHPIPAMGQGSLPIGSHEDSLSNVYGMSRPQKDTAKQRRNQNKTLRARAVLIEGSIIDMSRSFLVTYYLEDDSLQISEENQRNSGIMTGSFLKRGRYMNDGATMRHRQKVEEDLINSPPRFGVPTKEQQLALLEPVYISASEIYLGSILTINNYVMKIIEMDNLSLKFCESYPNEFPFSDVNRILKSVIATLEKQRLDLRPIFRRIDTQNIGFLSQEVFFVAFDSLNIVDALNEQEILSLIRRFQEKASVLQTARLPGATSSPTKLSSAHPHNDNVPSSAMKHNATLLLSALANNGFGEAREESIFCYDDFCDFLVYLCLSQEENLAINILPSSAQDAWIHMMNWCRSRPVPWRQLFRQQSLAQDSGITLGKLSLSLVQQLLLKHGVPSSLVTAVLPWIQSHFSVSAEESRLLLEHARKRAFAHSQSHSFQRRKNSPDSISAPTSPIGKFNLLSSPLNSPQSPQKLTVSPFSGTNKLSSSPQVLSPTHVSSTSGRIASLRRLRDKISMQMEQQNASLQPISCSLNDTMQEVKIGEEQLDQVLVDVFALCDQVFQAIWLKNC